MLLDKRTKALEALQGDRKKLILVLSGIVILLCYHLIFFRLFPNRNGLLGEDFSLFLPRLLDGYIWAKNNSAFSIPWFTPSFCGGEPAYPDPQNIYFTIPQAFTAYFNPLQSIYFAIVAMSAAGFTGTYFALRSVYKSSASSAMLGSTLFLFNGFFIYRMAMGAIVFHSIMLFPWIVYFAFKETKKDTSSFRIRDNLLNAIVIALIAAYWLYSGMVNILVPLALSFLVIVLGRSINGNLKPEFWKISIIAFALLLALVASKLNAEMAYLKIFDRSFYDLGGTRNLFDGFYISFRSLFFPSTKSDMVYLLTNQKFFLGRHEFEYGVTFVPLLLLGIFFIRQRIRIRDWFWQVFQSKIHLAIFALIVLILLIPVLFNYYQPDWNRLLKSLPVLKNSSTLIRFNVMYILPIVIISVMAFDKALSGGMVKILSATGFIVLIIAINALTDKTFYQKQPYNPEPINNSYAKIKISGETPTINFVGNIENSPFLSNAAQIGADFTVGISRLRCYEPMFGYQLEAMPIKTLHQGPVTDVTAGTLNIKNPACYVFPKSNGCVPGDHFKVSELNQAKKFTGYHPYDFIIPKRQTILNYITLVTLLGCLLLLALAICERVWPWLKRELRQFS